MDLRTQWNSVTPLSNQEETLSANWQHRRKAPVAVFFNPLWVKSWIFPSNNEWSEWAIEPLIPFNAFALLCSASGRPDNAIEKNYIDYLAYTVLGKALLSLLARAPQSAPPKSAFMGVQSLGQSEGSREMEQKSEDRRARPEVKGLCQCLYGEDWNDQGKAKLEQEESLHTSFKSMITPSLIFFFISLCFSFFSSSTSKCLSAAVCFRSDTPDICTAHLIWHF